MTRRRFLIGLLAASALYSRDVGPSLASLRHGGAGLSQLLLTPPAAFTSSSGWTPNFAVYRLGNGQIITNFNPYSLVPSISKTYYVNPLTGSDSNAGTSWAAPRQNVSTTLLLSDVDAIVLEDFGVSNTVYWGIRGWNGASPTRSQQITTRNGNNVYLVKGGSSLAPTWTLVAGNCYSTPTTSGVTNPTCTDLKNLNSQGFGGIVLCTASSGPPGTNPTAGNGYLDTTNNIFYCTAIDSRSLIGDGMMIPPLEAGNNGSINLTTDIAPTLWMQNLSFIGGTPFNAQQLTNLTNYPTLVFVNCTFQGSNSAGNGTNVLGNFYIYLVTCGASGNANDNFNIHGTNTGGFGTQCRRFMQGCYTNTSGFVVGATNNNACTQHEDCRSVGVGNLFQNSQNRVLANIDTSVHWELDSTIGPSLASSGSSAETVQAGGAAAQIYLDTCTIIPSAFADIESSLAACGVYIYNSTPPLASLTKTGSGTIAAYSP